MEDGKKFRVIFSSIILTIILIGWFIFAIDYVFGNEKIVMKKAFERVKNDFDVVLKDVNFKESNETYQYKLKDKNYTIGLYNKNDNFYIYNNDSYYDIGESLKKNNLNIDIKNIDKEKIEIMLNEVLYMINLNNHYVNMTKRVNRKEKNYIYSYSINSFVPFAMALKDDKKFIDAFKDIFNCKKKDVLNFLDKIKYQRVELVVRTTGRTRKIKAYSINIENIISIINNGKSYDGYFLDLGFSYNKKKLTIYENNNKLKFEKVKDFTFDKDNYKKVNELNLASFMGI